ncbi:hypothetical protein [Symbiopectobacterium sp.]|uniref:hypothetical protein n=1 Tax=Symbiopectobacterium sp. TaxID=2952789 RepID=UPI003F6838ED
MSRIRPIGLAGLACISRLRKENHYCVPGASAMNNIILVLLTLFIFVIPYWRFRRKLHPA